MTPHRRWFELALDLIRRDIPASTLCYQPTVWEMEVAAVMQPEELHIAAYYVPFQGIAPMIVKVGQAS